MERVKQILDASLLWRVLMALCLWFGDQWRQSAVVRWFLNPPVWGQAATRNSLLYRLWSLMWGGLHRLFRALRLNRLFEGSVFLHTAFWCALPVILAPLLPTMAVLALALVAYCAVALRLLQDGGHPLAYSPVNKYLLLYAGVYLAAAFMSVTPRGSLQPALLIVFFTLVPVAMENTFTTRKALEMLAGMMVLAGTLVGAIGVGQYLLGATGAAAWVDSDMFSGITTRVWSTLQNPNVLAEYLLLTIPLGVALCLTGKAWKRRMFWLACCGVMGLCMIFTFSRGGWLGLIIAAGIFVLLLEPRLLMLAPFALVALYFVMPDTVINRLLSVGNLGDSSTSYRVAIWMGSLAMLKDYWMCGIGPGTAAFNLVYPAYSYSAANAQHAHNLYLQMTIDGGICLLLLFLVVLFVLYRRSCACIAREKGVRRIHLIAILSGLTGFLAQSMTDYSFYNYRVVLVFWATIGLGACWLNLKKEAAK